MNRNRGLKNILASLLAQLITTILGLVIPRLVLVNLGSEANGLLNSITTALTYMSLLEAGVGMATLNALYTPIANKDKSKISQIMAATDYFYKRTGIVYLIVVIILSFSFSFFLNSSIPRAEVFLVVLLSGLSGVLSYFFQGKFKILLSAEGKSYITTNIGTITHIGISLFKIIVLINGGDVVAVQTVYFLFNLIQLLIFVFYMNKYYKWVDYKTKPDFTSISQKNAVLVHQLAGLVFNNTDVLILTIFTSLKEVSVYSMYALIYGTIKQVTITVDGYLYALGQNFQNREHFLRLFDAYEVFKLAFTTSLFCITYSLMLPFLKLYTSGVNDIAYINENINLLFVIFYILHTGRQPSGQVIDIAQRFEDTKWRSVLEATINLTASVILTIKFGIYGVLLGTIIALLYRTNDMIIYASKILNRSCWITYRRWLINIGVFIATSYLMSLIHIEVNSYFVFLIVAGIESLIVIPLFFIINSIFEPKVAKYSFSIVKGLINYRIKPRSDS